MVERLRFRVAFGWGQIWPELLFLVAVDALCLWVLWMLLHRGGHEPVPGLEAVVACLCVALYLLLLIVGYPWVLRWKAGLLHGRAIGAVYQAVRESVAALEPQTRAERERQRVLQEACRELRKAGEDLVDCLKLPPVQPLATPSHMEGVLRDLLARQEAQLWLINANRLRDRALKAT